MTTSSYLGGQSGVQYNGIETDDGGYPKFNLQNVLLVGEFKRGPFHKPFKVTKETMEAQLSYDYANPYYIALEDAFKTGAEYLWVMRVDATVYVWGEWQVNASIAIQNNKARYTAYKTNGKVAFDSFAEVDLTAVITASLSDLNMQQWQAVKDAANELTNVANWVFNNANETVEYSVGDPLYQYRPEGSNIYYETGADACNATIQNLRERPDTIDIWNIEYSAPYCRATYSYYNPNLGYTPTNSMNAWISKYNRTTPLPILNVTYQQVAKKIISNASSSDQGISLLAETYIEQVTKNINLDNLIPQFEANKTQQ